VGRDVTHVVERARTITQSRGSVRCDARLSLVAVAVALALLLLAPISAGAQDANSTAKSHSLAVNLQFPDNGLTSGEQLCVALFSGTSPDVSKPPLLSRCLDPGNSAVTFEGLRQGDFSVLLPGPGSKLAEDRYQGQLVGTSIPDDDRLDAYGIDVNVALAPDYAGTTGRVQVSVYGCPAGTNAGSNKADWATECQALAGGVPLTLTGTGSIDDAAFRGVTGVSGNDSGRVDFTNLPAGAYQLAGDLPDNVSDNPALFVESSIDGSLGTLDPSDTLALRPTETVAVDVYLVLDPNDSETNSAVGLSDPTITGGIAGG
jgi:hypothetical protein